MRKYFSLLGVLAMVAAAAPLARADFLIAYSLNGGGVQLCADSASDLGGSCDTSTPVSIGGGVTLFDVSGSSNSPGVASGADEFGSTTTITTGSTGATVVLYWAAQDFTQPATNGSVTGIDYTSEMGITNALSSGSATVTLESCVDESNDTVPAPAASGFCTTPAATLTNSQTLPAGLGSSSHITSTTTFSPLNATYSLSQAVTLVIGANTSLNLSTSQALTPVPEPAGIALLGGLILLTSGAIRRKRRQEAPRA